MENRDKLHINRVLESIESIRSYLPQDSDQEISKNTLVYDAILMRLVVIGEETFKLSEQFKQGLGHIPWDKIKGFRNIAVHNYDGLEASTVMHIAKYELDDLYDALVPFRTQF